jgi:hypothetical protein
MNQIKLSNNTYEKYLYLTENTVHVNIVGIKQNCVIEIEKQQLPLL